MLKTSVRADDLLRSARAAASSAAAVRWTRDGVGVWLHPGGELCELSRSNQNVKVQIDHEAGLQIVEMAVAYTSNTGEVLVVQGAQIDDL